MVRNFKDHAVTYPGRYLAGMEVPAFGSVAALITWLNENPQMVLSPDFGAIIQAGTKNNAENLNEAQKDSLIYLPATRTNGGLVDRYVHSAAELDAMFINPACGIFGAKALFVPSASNTLAAPVIKVGETDFTICIANTPVGVNYLHANKCYLMLLDVGVQKANLVQLEITDSTVMKDVLTRLSTLETIHSKRKLLLRTPVAAGTEYNIPIELVPQIITICAHISDTGTVAAETYLDISNGIMYREYKVELFLVGGELKMKSLQETDTSDTVQVKFSIANKTLTYIQYTTNTNAIMVVSEVFL